MDFPQDYRAHVLLVQSNMGQSDHLEHLLESNILLKIIYQSEGKHHTHYTQCWRNEDRKAPIKQQKLFSLIPALTVHKKKINILYVVA